MIAIADLLDSQRLPGNYFAPGAYIRGDLELGLLENRRGDRFLALPATLFEAIYAGLEQETGTAARLVLFNCGRWWGKNFYVRFCEEVSEYYSKPVAEMEMVEFIQCLQECWKTLGWGTFEFDQTYYQQGFLEVRIGHSPFAEKAPQWNRPVCFLEAGILSSFFSQLTGRDIHCLQTTCESLGADCNRFVLGLPERLKPAEAWVTEGQEHQKIMAQLCA
ncbi:V4R domain-containing protein [Kamptonema formosum]|uniref:V4R domain-containing protein n=1 Tax=Kamptonema formosum TaxID=331992 RepID=UPI000347E8AD|nr:V4R domain-containing protein [Oscillatoria sp. PCC 10802]